MSIRQLNTDIVAPREGSVDRNIRYQKFSNINFVAPREGAWIEMEDFADESVFTCSRSPRGSVDRNTGIIQILIFIRVAPREGSVDRN